MFVSVCDGFQVNKEGVVLGKKGNIISQQTTKTGYKIVNVVVNGKRTVRGVHRLVALAFIPNPNNLSDVNHKDNNRQNNSVKNLEWMTHGDNIQYSYDTQQRTALGELNANCKNRVETIVEICILLASGESAAKIRDLGYSYSLVRAIKARRNWVHISKDYF